MMSERERREAAWLIGASVVLLILLLVSGWRPYDRLTWLMEVAPILIAWPILAATWRRLPLTPLLYGLIFAHALILLLGGAYTYARVPAGFWVQELFELSRNPYDRLGHFAQGLVPAMLAREVLLRVGLVNGRRSAAVLAVCVAMTVSALYELIEWAAALVMGAGAESFLGMQGDIWDTQSDMFMALIGATFAMLALARLQDAQIAVRERTARLRRDAVYDTW